MLLAEPPLRGENGPSSMEHVRPHDVPYGKGVFGVIGVPDSSCVNLQSNVWVRINSTVKLSNPVGEETHH
jgi:hypothetical protein